eukprot:8463717-Lingulodinium_polyedra.AAC.1
MARRARSGRRHCRRALRRARWRRQRASTVNDTRHKCMARLHMPLGPQQGDGRAAAMLGVDRRLVKGDMKEHFRMMRRGACWHSAGREPRQESGMDR